MGETPKKDPITELFTIYQQRTGESITERFFRLRKKDTIAESNDPEDRTEETFWTQATDAAARFWSENIDE